MIKNNMIYLSRKNDIQGSHQSYVGGKPSLPPRINLPVCQLCKQFQTFMFQVAFPTNFQWSGKTISCFACMRCVDERYLIPEMLPDHRAGSDIPAGFLSMYQRNFSLLIFPTMDAIIVDNYKEQVEFFALEDESKNFDFCKIGGNPNWVLDDETPTTYDSTVPMIFLMELMPGIQFAKIDNAPPQIELDIFGRPSPSPLSYYQLFLGNAIYFFGTSKGESLVYAITQV